MNWGLANSLPQRGRWRGANGSVTDEEVAIKIYFTGVVWILFVAQGFFLHRHEDHKRREALVRATSSSTTFGGPPKGEVFEENSRTSVAAGGVCALSAGEGCSLNQNLNGKLQFSGEFDNSNIFKYFQDYVVFDRRAGGTPAASSISNGLNGGRRGVPRSEHASFGGSELAPALQCVMLYAIRVL